MSTPSNHLKGWVRSLQKAIARRRDQLVAQGQPLLLTSSFVALQIGAKTGQAAQVINRALKALHYLLFAIFGFLGWLLQFSIEIVLFPPAPDHVESLTEIYRYFIPVYVAMVFVAGMLHLVGDPLAPNSDQTDLKEFVQKVIVTALAVLVGPYLIGLSVDLSNAIGRFLLLDQFTIAYMGTLTEKLVGGTVSVVVGVILAVFFVAADVLALFLLYLMLAGRILLIYSFYAIFPLLMGFYVLDVGYAAYGRALAEFSIKVFTAMLIIAVLGSAILGVGGTIASQGKHAQLSDESQAIVEEDDSIPDLNGTEPIGDPESSAPGSGDSQGGTSVTAIVMQLFAYYGTVVIFIASISSILSILVSIRGKRLAKRTIRMKEALRRARSGGGGSPGQIDPSVMTASGEVNSIIEVDTDGDRLSVIGDDGSGVSVSGDGSIHPFEGYRPSTSYSLNNEEFWGQSQGTVNPSMGDVVGTLRDGAETVVDTGRSWAPFDTREGLKTAQDTLPGGENLGRALSKSLRLGRRGAGPAGRFAVGAGKVFMTRGIAPSLLEAKRQVERSQFLRPPNKRLSSEDQPSATEALSKAVGLGDHGPGPNPTEPAGKAVLGGDGVDLEQYDTPEGFAEPEVERVYQSMNASVSRDEFAKSMDFELAHLKTDADRKTAALLAAHRHDYVVDEIAELSDYLQDGRQFRLTGEVLVKGEMGDYNGKNALSIRIGDETGHTEVSFWESQAAHVAETYEEGDSIAVEARASESDDGTMTIYGGFTKPASSIAEPVEGVTPLDRIENYDRSLRVQGRVASAWNEPYTEGDGVDVSMLTLHDQTARREVKLYGEAAHEVSDITPGDTLTISGLTAVYDADIDKQVLKGGDETSFEPVQEDFYYTPESMSAAELEPGDVGTVAGTVIDAGELSKTQNDTPYRQLRLVDETGVSRVNLFGATITGNRIEEGDTIALTDAEVYEYNDQVAVRNQTKSDDDPSESKILHLPSDTYPKRPPTDGSIGKLTNDLRRPDKTVSRHTARGVVLETQEPKTLDPTHEHDRVQNAVLYDGTGRAEVALYDEKIEEIAQTNEVTLLDAVVRRDIRGNPQLHVYNDTTTITHEDEPNSSA